MLFSPAGMASRPAGRPALRRKVRSSRAKHDPSVTTVSFPESTGSEGA